MRIIGPIMCAVCKREVERVETIRNECTMSFTVRVYCHGAMEEARLDDLDLRITDHIDAVAFGPKVNPLPTS